jgi:hypothetical protein
VGLLLACDGIDVNKAMTNDGTTPLFMAFQKGHTEVVGLLLACDGIDVNKAMTTRREQKICEKNKNNASTVQKRWLVVCHPNRILR